MDSEEMYLYGILMALAEEQDESIQKLVNGSLGFFGKLRVQSRGREIGKFISKISNYKTKVGIKNVHESILADIAWIEDGNFPKTYSSDVFKMLKNYL